MKQHYEKIQKLSPEKRRLLDNRLNSWLSMDRDGQKSGELVVYYAADESLSPEQVRSHLSNRLPEYMVPRACVRLESLPKTTNGKVDRVLLQSLRSAFVQVSSDDSSADLSDMEEQMVRIWKRILNVSHIGVSDDFFAKGGHSLLATQVVMEIEQEFGLSIPLNTLFRYPSVSSLCSHLEGEESYRTRRKPVLKDYDDVHPPLSNAQRRLWYISELSDDGLEYKIIKAINVTGDLDLPVLRESVRGIVDRHESLRTTFGYVDGKLVQKIDPKAKVEFEEFDYSDLEPDELKAKLKALQETIRSKPFDLSVGPLIRLTYVQLGEDRAQVIFDVHHIIIDGWSFGLLVKELNCLYYAHKTGNPSGLEELNVQYRDYALWERERLTSEVLGEQIAYWRAKLSGSPRLSFPRSKQDGSRYGEDGEFTFDFDPELSRSIREYCAESKCTPFVFMIGAYYAMLYCETKTTDICIGTDFANRDSKDFGKLIGFFVNQLVLRVAFEKGIGFDQLLELARSSVEEALAHKELPYDALVRELNSKSNRRESLFRAKFVFHTELPSIELPGIRTSFEEIKLGMTKFDLLLNVEECSTGLKGKFEYSGKEFDERSIRSMAEQYLSICAMAVRNRVISVSEMEGEIRKREGDRSDRFLEEERARRSDKLRQMLRSK